jgi:serine/threonine protein kinase
MPGPQFVVITGPDKDRQFPVHPGTGFLMGRHQDTAYTLKDPRASRQHCEICNENGVVKVIDRGGSGGTLVNGAKIAEQVLTHGDTLQVGETMLKFLTRDEASANTTINAAPGGNAEYDPKAVDQLATLSGRTLAHFQLGDILGKGTTSMVFKATDANTGEVVALKVMQPEYSRNEDDMQRFVRAMKTMMPLRHPNLVAVLGAGRSGPYCWSAMELVEGESLTDVIKRIGVAGMLDWKYAFKVGVQIGRALDYAHAQGIIHRDVAPANILIRASDKSALLGDLMLAKALEGALAQQVTKPGQMVGDVNYMSPERTRGQADQIDGRSDIFGLGATCYTLYAGKPPFAGTTLVETITRVRQSEPLKPSTFQLGIPGLFEAVILKMLAKRPDDRYQTAGELVAELERIGKYNGVTV